MRSSTVLEKKRKDILRQSIQSVTDDQQINWDDVKTKLQQGDITYTLAVSIAQRKIEELDATHINEKALKYERLVDYTRFLAHVLFAVYMSLSLFQKPDWCLRAQDEDPSFPANCNGEITPTSNIPYLPIWALIALEAGIITFLTVRKHIQTRVLQRGKRKLRILYALCLMVYVSHVLQYALRIRFPFNQCIRPLYFLVYIKVVRRNLMLYLRIFWRSREIFIVIAGVFFFYVCLARIIFYQTVQNTAGPMNFDTFPNTLYNLFVAMTTSNYPDLMMPIFKENRMASLYFISFMAIVSLVLLNIILAYFYFNYKEELSGQVKRFQRKNTYKGLFDDSIELSEDHHHDTSLDHHHMAHSFDESGNQTQFLKEMELLHKQDLEKKLGSSTWKRAIMETLNLFSVKTIFAMGGLLVFLLAVVQSNEVNPDPETDLKNDEITYGRKFDHYWLIVQLVLNSFLFLDPFLRVTIMGWKSFLRSKFLVFEFIYSISVLFFISLRIIGLTVITLTFIKIILILRLYRFMRWVNSFSKYRLIFSSLFKLVPLFVHLVGVIGLTFYIYTTIGTIIFGGKLRTDLNINFSQYGVPSYYVYVNFNDFYMGLFTCFHLLIVNNWLYTVDVHCRVMNNFSYRIFFVSFYIFVVTICLNIMIAFIIDMFTTQIHNKNDKTKDRWLRQYGKKEVPEENADWSPVTSPKRAPQQPLEGEMGDLILPEADEPTPERKPSINLISADGNDLQTKLI